MLAALDALPDLNTGELPGVYIEVTGRLNERLKTDSLNASDLVLLSYRDGSLPRYERDSATVFASAHGIKKLRKKVEQFETENTPDREKDGEIVPGRPKNANLVQSISAITEAGLRALWRSPVDKFPVAGGASDWEVWLEPNEVQNFTRRAIEFGVDIGTERLEFPEDVVVRACASQDELASAIRQLGGVRSLAAPSVTADFFDSIEAEEQAEWVAELAERTVYPEHLTPGYLTLLDTGVSRAHPLIQPVLSADDRHAANPAWALDDLNGHGTQMAGLALYGDLNSALQLQTPVSIGYRLESAKLLPDAGANPHHLLGSVTRDAINAAEQNHPRRRTFAMAVTTSADTPHDGAPTSWSSEVDQLVAGISGNVDVPRLMLISAGNTDNASFGTGDYLATCDHPDNEIESPAQAWNALCIGAFTEKTGLPEDESDSAVAPFGDLSPSSRTASWSSQWPLKPDVVLEGGNWTENANPPPMRHEALSLLTTSHQYPQRSFCLSHDTSAATALAAKEITELWSEYPELWPETVRGLYVSSARWTPQMASHLPRRPQKGDYARLFQRYGYGVPSLERARRSASNALTLIVEDTITPYGLSENTGNDVHNEMRLFNLPWPVEELRALGNSEVTLRVALSTFVAPNPSEVARGSKYRYASHNLRFKLNRADETKEQFMARISKAAEVPDGPESRDEDLWQFGSVRRDVGSLHIDQLTCAASDMARRNIIAVHPVAGWWKSKAILELGLPTVRYALVVEIDAERIDTDLYAEVRTEIEALIAAENVVVV